MKNRQKRSSLFSLSLILFQEKLFFICSKQYIADPNDQILLNIEENKSMSNLPLEGSRKTVSPYVAEVGQRCKPSYLVHTSF